MLSVDVDQLNTQAVENGYGHRHAVDPANIFAVQVDFPLNQNFRVIFHAVIGKPGKLRHLGKHRPNGSLVGAGADHVPIGPLTQNGGNGIDNDGFTGTGLAGKYMKALTELDIGALDYCNIFNMQKT